MISQASGSYKGVCLASEQELFSHKLILVPSFVIQSPSPHSSPDAGNFGSGNTTEKLVSICISKQSLKLDIANCLESFPPRSINVLFRVPVSGSSGNNSSAEYQDVLDNIICTPMPDGSPYYHDLLGATERYFKSCILVKNSFPSQPHRRRVLT
ncbi:rab escort protein 1-like [Lycium barbarum]|uniref:rab escort protein 1-like n=1 Tax=Lycium barbarum TaxID=112863 RepID=UPI00293E7780|nr:rab escort protein 1-like [Lycium barbarum]